MDDRRRLRGSKDAPACLTAWGHNVYETYRAAGQGRYRAYLGLGARWTRIL